MDSFSRKRRKSFFDEILWYVNDKPCINKDRDYQDLSVEDIELVVTEIDSINALYNCSQKTLPNVNQVNSF